MIRAAIFDVDGTLLDSMPIWQEASARYLKLHHNIDAEPGLADRMSSMSIPEGSEYLKRTYALSSSPEEIVTGIISIVRDFYFKEAPLKPGVKEFLEEMKTQGIPMVIATSSDRSYLDAALRRNGIEEYFERIFTCAEVGSGKTKPEIYYQAGIFLGCQPEEICVFEDAFYAANTAKKAGFYVVGLYDASFAAYEEDLKELCDVYMKDFREKDTFWEYFHHM